MPTGISNTTYPNSSPPRSLKRQLLLLIYFSSSVLKESNSNIPVIGPTFISLDIRTDGNLLPQIGTDRFVFLINNIHYQVKWD